MSFAQLNIASIIGIILMAVLIASVFLMGCTIEQPEGSRRDRGAAGGECRGAGGECRAA